MPVWANEAPQKNAVCCCYKRYSQGWQCCWNGVENQNAATTAAYATSSRWHMGSMPVLVPTNIAVFWGTPISKNIFLIVCASDVGSDILDEPPLARSMFTQTKKRILTCPFLHNISVGLNINKRCSWQVRLRKSRPIGGEVTPTSSMSNLKVVKSKCGKSPSGRRGSRSSKLRTPWTFQRFHVFQFWMVEFLGDV